MKELRERLTKGEDVVDPKTWAGSIPAALGIAPRLQIGANRWFNLVWLLAQRGSARLQASEVDCRHRVRR
ncbi:hypothetical protein QEG98_28800 [Myxococcus sp. MxC21-1]|uniref:hypothetical protein n=1 Tax=Myxococcus sp. MxC21-1 TaxID=3041439 RepID=UPI00292F489A|nr:hypothetical protein [Myxococcus sp. MxC21-1]WNZ59999.1 hypothetical protein QEG98_28800 [Myxococcus sp. MxC21-1]